MNIISAVALGWFGRRILDWGGWLGTFLLSVIGIYNSLPPGAQESIHAVVSGRWQDITLGAIVPLGALVWSQVVSFRSTVRPQVVTTRGQRVETDNLAPAVQQEINASVAGVGPKTILDALIDKLNRNR